MVRRTRKRNLKLRGTRTVGKGIKNRHGGKGKGSRGGKGNAWCKHLWVKTLVESGKHYGRNGFYNPTRDESKVVNVGVLCTYCDRMIVDKQKMEMEGNAVKVNLSELGFDKVLGFGNVNRPLVIIGQASKSAIKKIEKAGGKVVC